MSSGRPVSHALISAALVSLLAVAATILVSRRPEFAQSDEPGYVANAIPVAGDFPAPKAQPSAIMLPPEVPLAELLGPPAQLMGSPLADLVRVPDVPPSPEPPKSTLMLRVRPMLDRGDYRTAAKLLQAQVKTGRATPEELVVFHTLCEMQAGRWCR